MDNSKVVVISDKWTNSDGWSQNLKQHGTRVDLIDFSAANHYKEALRRYKLAIFDIHEEAESVVPIIRILRESSDVPALVLTHSRDERVLKMLYAAGVEECIVKPISNAVLLVKINAWLDRIGLFTAAQYRKAMRDPFAPIIYSLN